MVKKTTGRSAVQGRESKILQGSSRKSWQQIRAAQVLWGPKRGAFLIGRGVERPDANFCSATRGKEPAKDKRTPPPKQQQSFSSFSTSPFLIPTKQQKHRQYAYLQGATLICPEELQLELATFHLLELESLRFLWTTQQLPEPLSPELTRPLRMLSPETR
jgi:hypothetical protein